MTQAEQTEQRPDHPTPFVPGNPPGANAGPWYVKDNLAPRPEGITVPREQIINRQGKDFVLWAGLLETAHKHGLQSIRTFMVQTPSTLNGGVAIVHATAEFPWGTFDGIGDADDGNVSRNIAPHKIRMAETRAKARALRDALSIGMAAIEELGPEPGEQPDKPARAVPDNGVGTAAPRPVQRPDGSSSTTSTPGTRKSYGTPLTKGPVQDNRWPSGQ